MPSRSASSCCRTSSRRACAAWSRRWRGRTPPSATSSAPWPELRGPPRGVPPRASGAAAAPRRGRPVRRDGRPASRRRCGRSAEDGEIEGAWAGTLRRARGRHRPSSA
jgi:hypothetical protein